ncbi:MAG: SDR family NAD(P)-dependent oxidoreductase [Solirubrobacteraceae bacterium]
MKDATGRPQRVAVIGGTSEIAQHAVRALVAAGGVRDVVLTARDPQALEAFDPGVATATLAWNADASDADNTALVADLWAGGDVDLVLVAVGVLPDQAAVEADPAGFAAVAQANFTGPAALGLRLAARLREQGHGTLAVISTVAAERARADNYIYGASKAGLDAFFTGLGDRLHGSGVDVLVIRPGFVHTRMTAGMAAAPMSVGPDVVGAAIAAAVAAGGTRTVWAPAKLRPMMAILRHLPRPLFRKLAESRS